MLNDRPHHPSRRCRVQCWLRVALVAATLGITYGGCRPPNAGKGRVVGELRDVCRSGEAKICFALGWMHLDGKVGRKSPLLAFRYWNLSCHLGYGPACDMVWELRGLRSMHGRKDRSDLSGRGPQNGMAGQAEFPPGVD